MARPIFRRLDPRLAAELRPRRRLILLGLSCTLVAGILDVGTIPLINGAFTQIGLAAPRSSSDAAAARAREKEQAARASDLAARLGAPEEEVLRALVNAQARAEDARDTEIPAALVRASGRSEKEVRAVLAEVSPKPQGDPEALKRLAIYCGLVVLLYGTKYWFTRGQSLYLSRASAELTADLRRRIFAKLQRLPVAYFTENRAGAIQSVLTNDVNAYGGAVGIVRDSVDAPVRAIGAFLAILYYQWQLALVFIVMLPAMATVIRRNAAKMRQAQAVVQDDLAEVSAFTVEALAGTRVVKAFAAEERIRALYDTRVDRSLGSQVAAAKRQAALRPLVELIGAGGIAAVILAAGYLAYRGQANLGQIIGLIFGLDRINQAFRSLGNMSNVYSQVQAATDRVHSLVLDVPDAPEPAQGLRPEHPAGRVEFEHVTFRYPDGTEALEDVSFTLEPGHSLALVGPSGAGKSTIADLLLRFYDPSEGRILLDGTDLRELDPEWLRNRIGVVPQLTFLFAGTVAENVRMGAPEADEAAVHEALRMAHATPFVEALPERTGADIGEGGGRLSGGQRQRLAIARALVRKPTILLLDEATSALDAESERAVTEALDGVMRERTTLFIAHRLTTAARADKIVVLSAGRVVETGSHAELLAAGGAYAGLFRAFAGGVLA